MSRAGWKLTTLGQFCEVFSGYPFKSIGFTDDPNDIPLVKGENIGQGEVLWDISKRWPIQDLAELERYKLIKGDVVLAMDRPWVPAGLKFAKITASAPDALLVQRVARLRGRKGLDQSFLAQLIASPSFVGYVQSVGRGVGVPHISSKEIGAFTFWLPPLMEQEKIGNTLSAYDDLIDNNRRRMALLEDSARQLYREWFVRLRFPGYEHTPIVDGVPQGWERRTAFDSMQVLSGGTPKTSISDYWDGETPFFTPKDALDGIWVSSCERSLTELGIKNCNSKLYPRETVFITARGTVGKLNMAQTPMAMSQSCYALVAKDHLSQRFIYSAMKEGVEALKQQAVGAVFDAIVVDTFKRIHLTIPTATVLRLFDQAVEPVFSQVENLASQNQKLRQARDLLLPRLMNGELAV